MDTRIDTVNVPKDIDRRHPEGLKVLELDGLME